MSLHMVVQELVTTEKSYLVDLTDICHGYLKGLVKLQKDVDEDLEKSYKSLLGDQQGAHITTALSASTNNLALFLPALRNSWASHQNQHHQNNNHHHHQNHSFHPHNPLRCSQNQEVKLSSKIEKERHERMLTNEELAVLFGNIQELQQFHQTLCSHFEKSRGDLSEIARVFIENEDKFVSLYSYYCVNYPNAVNLLSDLIHNRAYIFSTLQQLQSEMGHALPFGSYILKPVQRILKYHLLLGELMKHCQNIDPISSRMVSRGLEVMTSVAQQVNEIQRRYEDAVHVQEIQSILLDWNEDAQLTSFGAIHLEDQMRMLGARDCRQLFLFDKILLITKIAESGFLQHKAHIFHDNLILLERVLKDDLAFQVAPHDNSAPSMTFVARNSETKQRWTQALKKAVIDSYQSSVPTLARPQLQSLQSAVRQDSVSRHSLDIGGSKVSHEKRSSLDLRRRLSLLVPQATSGCSTRIKSKNNLNNPGLKMVDRNEIECIKVDVRNHLRGSCEILSGSSNSNEVASAGDIACCSQQKNSGVHFERWRSETFGRNGSLEVLERSRMQSLNYPVENGLQKSSRYSRRSTSNLLPEHRRNFQIRAESNASGTQRARNLRSSSAKLARSPSINDDERDRDDDQTSHMEEHENVSDYFNSVLEPKRREFVSQSAEADIDTSVKKTADRKINQTRAKQHDTVPRSSDGRSFRTIPPSMLTQKPISSSKPSIASYMCCFTRRKQQKSTSLSRAPIYVDSSNLSPDEFTSQNSETSASLGLHRRVRKSKSLQVSGPMSIKRDPDFNFNYEEGIPKGDCRLPPRRSSSMRVRRAVDNEKGTLDNSPNDPENFDFENNFIVMPPNLSNNCTTAVFVRQRSFNI